MMPEPHSKDKALSTFSNDEHNDAEQVLTDEGSDTLWEYTTPPSTPCHNVNSLFAAKSPTKRSGKKWIVNEQEKQQDTVEVMHEFKNFQETLDQSASLSPSEMSIAAPPPPPATTSNAPVITIAPPPPSIPEMPSSMGTRDSSPSELAAPRALQVGDKVKCCSVSQKRWSNATAKTVEENTIFVEYEQKDAKGNHMMKGLPPGCRHFRHTDKHCCPWGPSRGRGRSMSDYIGGC